MIPIEKENDVYKIEARLEVSSSLFFLPFENVSVSLKTPLNFSLNKQYMTKLNDRLQMSRNFEIAKQY